MRSIDLWWLSRLDKELPLPKLMYVDNPDFGGAYYFPRQGTFPIDQENMCDLRNGLIVISISFEEDDDDRAAIFAHEWRHHWQFFHYGRSSRSTFNWDGEYETYRKAIVSYFRTYTYEMDALRFQLEKCPRDDCTQEWMDWIKNDD